MIVLDTNVLSEALRPSPSVKVRRWMSGQSAASLFITTISEAEMLYGVAILPAGKRQSSLREAVVAIFKEDFANRVLPFDSAAAEAFADMAADRRRSGRPLNALDGQIASIARSRGAAIATRNSADFEGCGVPIIDPWTA